VCAVTIAQSTSDGATDEIGNDGCSAATHADRSPRWHTGEVNSCHDTPEEKQHTHEDEQTN
jgi:hypothetical protein